MAEAAANSREPSPISTLAVAIRQPRLKSEAHIVGGGMELSPITAERSPIAAGVHDSTACGLRLLRLSSYRGSVFADSRGSLVAVEAGEAASGGGH